MKKLLPAILALLFAVPLLADNRGDVIFEHRSRIPGEAQTYYEAWLHVGWTYAFGYGATPLIYKSVPYLGPGHFFMPAPNEIVFHSDQTVSVWDGVPHIFTEPGKGYTDVFQAGAELGEIAPMRSGHFLVPRRGGTLIEFSLQGEVAEYPFADTAHIELLADQCTVLSSTANRIGRTDICARRALSDFATLRADETAGAIRQLPNRDVLVASGNAVVQYDANGAFLRSYPFPGVTHVALAPDGATFWAGGVDDGKAELRHYDPSAFDGSPQSIPLGNPEMTTAYVAVEATDLVVVGEWRAAAQPLKARVRAIR